MLLLCGIVFVVFYFIQAVVRTIEMTLAAILAPVMALGFLSGGGTTAAVWFREVVVLSASQAVRLLLLYRGWDA